MRNKVTSLDWPLNLIQDMIGESVNDGDGFYDTMEWPYESVPEDLTGTVMYLIARVPGERVQHMLLSRYRYGMTLTELAEEQGLTKERVRQIVAKGLRIMRSQEGCRFIRYGVKGYYELRMRRMVSQRISSLKDDIRQETRQEMLGKLEQMGYTKKQIAEAFTEIPDETGDIRLEELELSVRSYNCLRRAGCATVKDVVALGSGIVKVRNLGRRSLEEVTGKLVSLGYNEHKLWTD